MPKDRLPDLTPTGAYAPANSGMTMARQDGLDDRQAR